jgi:hypothetical protein
VFETPRLEPAAANKAEGIPIEPKAGAGYAVFQALSRVCPAHAAAARSCLAGATFTWQSIDPEGKHGQD